MTVTVHNDLAFAVQIVQCGEGCGHPTEVDQLKPGSSEGVNTSATGVHNWWYVRLPGTAVALSCFDLYYTTYTPGAMHDLSQDVRCPTSVIK